MVEVALVIAVVIATWIYFVPSIIAMTRHHYQQRWIIAANVSLGWTFLGWLFARAWSLSGTAGRSTS